MESNKNSNVIVQTEMDSLIEILANNQDKNFIQRILNKNDYPELEGVGKSKGKVHTHLMSDAEIDGRFFVYPEVVQIDGELVKKNREEALDYALETGEYVELPTQSSASWFAQNYKKYWDNMGYKH
tara:strand:+ start:217 stop:594 length:378 start_codon:yes stop_codon:yes gene_type:complete